MPFFCVIYNDFYLMTPYAFEILSMTHSSRRRNIGTFITAATIAFFFALAAILRFVGAERTNITRWTLLMSLLGIRRRRRFLAVRAGRGWARLLVRQLVSTHTYLWCGHIRSVVILLQSTKKISIFSWKKLAFFPVYWYNKSKVFGIIPNSSTPGVLDWGTDDGSGQ